MYVSFIYAQVQDVSTIIQAEQKLSSNPNGAASGNLPGTTDDKSKDISGIVEHLLWKQHQSRNSNVNDFYDEIHNTPTKQQQQQHPNKNQTLMLNRINDSAVYQSLQNENDISNMKDEVRTIIINIKTE
jgi:hypothetical protein